MKTKLTALILLAGAVCLSAPAIAPAIAQEAEPELTVLAECGVLRNMFMQPMRLGDVLDAFDRDFEGVEANINRNRPAYVTVYRSSALPDEVVQVRYADRSGAQSFNSLGGIARQGRDQFVMSLPQINLRTGAADTPTLYRRPLGFDRELPPEAADQYYVDGEAPLYDRPFARQRYNFTGRCEVVGE